MLIQLASFGLSLIIGCVFGFSYGLLFLYQKKRALSFDSSNACSLFFWSHHIIFTALRMAGITLALCYLLPLPKIHFILVMISFMLIFWVVITQDKDFSHG